MIRDLTEVGIQMARAEAKERVMVQAHALAEERVLDALLPQPSSPGYEQPQTETNSTESDSREALRRMLRSGSLAEREIEVNTQERSVPTMQVFSNSGMEEMGMQIQDMMGQMMGGSKQTRQRRVKIEEAKEIFAEEEANKLIDQDQVVKEAIKLTEESGIVFLDEIDKIAKRGGGQGPDVSREGVQRDILPIVEGSTVATKYGQVKTDHILFIAAGAFHTAKVSDLIPELQGRFPIRVELDSLGEKELLQILQEPQNALPIQYKALLDTEKVNLDFTEDV